ncbi:MAG: hypothetical protein OXG58_07235 [Gemmatimonadetes bacterium]|nr:hypothetical protein [Gemmatimonadota bacterium]MCY3942512.1 hypothetical protein [Gemmatimonadota bacterium]
MELLELDLAVAVERFAGLAFAFAGARLGVYGLAVVRLGTLAFALGVERREVLGVADVRRLVGADVFTVAVGRFAVPALAVDRSLVDDTGFTLEGVRVRVLRVLALDTLCSLVPDEFTVTVRSVRVVCLSVRGRVVGPVRGRRVPPSPDRGRLGPRSSPKAAREPRGTAMPLADPPPELPPSTSPFPRPLPLPLGFAFPLLLPPPLATPLSLYLGPKSGEPRARRPPVW